MKRAALLSVSAMVWALSAQAAAAQVASPVDEGTSPAASADPAAIDVAEGEDPAGADEIVVTGTRLRSAFGAPTPVIASTAQELRLSSPAQLSDALNQLPAFKGSSSASNGTGSSNRDNGVSFLNLRGLGKERTLVLLDGRRMVSSTGSGVPDISLIPQELVQRVDVVTGGASAAYGSDAVAGVVNFILNDRFEGLRFSTQVGVSDRNDAELMRAAVTLGKTYGGGNGRLIASGEYFSQVGIGRAPTGRDVTDTQYGVGPSGLASPTRMIIPTSVYSAPQGGLINTGPLAGLRFLPNGSLTTFNVGTARDGSRQSGGDGVAIEGQLTADVDRYSTFARTDYDFGGVKVFGEGLFSQSESAYGYFPNNASSVTGNAMTIFRGNAFLPTSAAGAFGTGDSFTFSNIGGSVGFLDVKTRSRTFRLVGGLDWDLNADWTVSAYVMHGENRYRSQTRSDTNLRNFYAALDAVVDPASGRVVCRSTLAGLDPGCLPINIFGGNALSAEQRNYILGTAELNYHIKQDVASIIARGPAFALPAGNVDVAFGAEYRREDAVQTSDSISSSPVSTVGIRGLPASYARGFPGGYLYSVGLPFSGDYNVMEGFVEANVPILSDSALGKSLSLNGALRVIDYSTAGTVTTWKGGVVYEPFDDLRLRGTLSRDIRAPNLNDLFASPQALAATVNFNGASTFAFNVRSGNTALEAEKADTVTVGGVYRPSWLEGLALSVDYYKIKVAGAVATLTAQQTIDQCNLGVQIACANVQFIASPASLTIRTPTLNLSSLKTSGVDLDVQYTTNLGAGQLQARALVGYLEELSTALPVGARIERAGDLGTTGAPKWQSTGSLSYETGGGFQVRVQGRYIGKGKIDTTFAPTFLGDANNVSSIFYTDLALRQKLDVGGRKFEVFGTVNNLFDVDPRITPVSISGPYRATNAQLYDVVGRYFSVGASVVF